jgi:predicted nucleotide-binding protein
MRLLFQGGWRSERDPRATKDLIDQYCRELAVQIVGTRHQIILTSPRAYDTLIADEIASRLEGSDATVKDHVTYLLSTRYRDIPRAGRVLRFDRPRWWLEERTYFVQQSDAIIAIGGGKGTADCIQKAFLARKPVFVACSIPSSSTDAWKNRPTGYHYITPGDADWVSDVNSTAQEFMRSTIRTLDTIGATRYPRKVFVVHGRNHHARDTLVDILRRLHFDPIVLWDEPHSGLTIIEKLERDIANIGFAFVLYTPDDLGRLKDQPEQPRARQNVVFEHGLLMGLLGRERICGLVHGAIEMPSDCDGVICERFNDLRDEGIKIARILTQAGYQVDASRLL